MLNGHMETVIPSVFFQVNDVDYQRERLEIDDGDFLDLDWIKNNNDRLIIFSHGLEGNSERNYIKRPALYFSRKKWDILAWNCRSCSGEMNRLPQLYHHGSSDDLERVIQHVLELNRYKTIVLAGYSMGGSINIKYLGTADVPVEIKGSFNFSTPCNLKESMERVEEKGNRVYKNKFMSRLKEKALSVAQRFPGVVSSEKILEVKTFDQFHRAFTLPVLNLSNQEGFYNIASCSNFIPDIQRPVYLINAQNDPMLGPGCNPVEIANMNNYLYLEMPSKGGHLGFTVAASPWSYMETAADLFLNEVIK